jgi:hypothetical protein
VDALQAKLYTKGLQDVYSANVVAFNLSRSLDALDQQFFAISDENLASEQTSGRRMAAAYVMGAGMMLLSTVAASIQQTRAFSLLQRQRRRGEEDTPCVVSVPQSELPHSTARVTIDS